MPSASDFLNALNAANTRLDGVNTRLDGVNTRLDGVKASIDAVHSAVDKVNNTLIAGLNQLITLGTYTNLALFHNDEQNDTMICILEHISKNTCDLVSQSNLQTALQTIMKENTTILAQLYEATHAAAALTREREESLRKQIEKCCPEETPPPACTYQPCDTTRRIPEPPQVRPIGRG